MVKKYQPGNAINIYEELTDPDSGVPPNLVDASSITITLTDPTGDVIIDAVAMTNISLGRYEYLYQSSVDDITGPWVATVVVVRNGNTNIKKYTVFELTTEPVA
jgi:hypothetical protein